MMIPKIPPPRKQCSEDWLGLVEDVRAIFRDLDKYIYIHKMNCNMSWAE